MPVEFRNRTEPPSIAGWYYGRQKDEPHIAPRAVVVIQNAGTGNKESRVVSFAVPGGHPVSDFDWFGAVTEVREG